MVTERVWLTRKSSFFLALIYFRYLLGRHVDDYDSRRQFERVTSTKIWDWKKSDTSLGQSDVCIVMFSRERFDYLFRFSKLLFCKTRSSIIIFNPFPFSFCVLKGCFVRQRHNMIWRNWGPCGIVVRCIVLKMAIWLDRLPGKSMGRMTDSLSSQSVISKFYR